LKRGCELNSRRFHSPFDDLASQITPDAVGFHEEPSVFLLLPRSSADHDRPQEDYMADHQIYLDSGYETDRRWVTPAELAEILNVSVQTIRRAVRAGRLATCEVMPGLVRIDRESVPEARNSSKRSA